MQGILLVNLGTPDSPKPKDVKRYLTEFLTDDRVIDIPWMWRQLLVRGVIIPRRYKQSAKYYSEIWTDEGSPLMAYGSKVKNALQEKLGGNFRVELAMRYQNPSIECALQRLLSEPIRELIILPMFPQYASATTGSVHQKVMEILKKFIKIPETRFISHFSDHPSFINAFAALADSFNLQKYDHVLFSFHGLPERQIKKADSFSCCLKKSDCCHTFCPENRSCYSAQCHATARDIAAKLHIPLGKYSICFQSRLGNEPWLQPYASDSLATLAKEGKKRLLIFCPSFVCDCLETIYEIGVEYKREFTKAGGEGLDLVPGLNDHPLWIESLTDIIMKR